MEESEGVREEEEFFRTLDHGMRRAILLLLYDRVELSYTDLQRTLAISEGSFNFHLKQLAPFVQRTGKGTYILSDTGKLTVEVIHKIRKMERAPPEIGPVRPPPLSVGVVVRRIVALFLDALIFFIFTGLWIDPVFWNMVNNIVFHTGSILERHPWIFHPEHLTDVGQLAFYTVGAYAHIFFAVYIFATLMEAYKGQTLGKYVMGIRMVKINGEKVSVLESGLRNAGKVFLLPLDLAIGLIFYRRRGYLRFFDYYTEVAAERLLKA